MKRFIGFRKRVSEVSETYRKPLKAIKRAEDLGNLEKVSDTFATFDPFSTTPYKQGFTLNLLQFQTLTSFSEAIDGLLYSGFPCNVFNQPQNMVQFTLKNSPLNTENPVPFIALMLCMKPSLSEIMQVVPYPCKNF